MPDPRAFVSFDFDHDEIARNLDATHSAILRLAFSLKSTVSVSVPVVTASEVIRSIVTSACAQASSERQEVIRSSKVRAQLARCPTGTRSRSRCTCNRPAR